MAEFWTHDGTDWKKVKQPSGYQNGQWKDAKAAWVYDASAFDWVQIWTGAVEIPFFGGTGPVNLKGLFDGSQFGGTQPGKIVFRLVDNAVLGSGTTAGAAVELPDDWPWNPEIELRIGSGARLAGMGGDGGDGVVSTTPAQNGDSGGPALFVRYGSVSIDNAGVIAGGGGGGGGGGPSTAILGFAGDGGGGAGKNAGQAPLNGQDGTLTSGGDGSVRRAIGSETAVPPSERGGGEGGDGGDPGQSGQSGLANTGTQGSITTVTTGGAAGPAIDGASNVTFINRGTIIGSEVN